MSSFLTDFQTYCGDVETPETMLIASAYLTLSSVCDKKFYLNLEPHKIDTSVYMMFVGPAGLGKSTALNIGLEAIRNNTARNNIITVGSLSSRALKDEIERIGKDRAVKADDFDPFQRRQRYHDITATSVTICPDEAKNFFAISKEEMIGFFVEAYNRFDLYMEHLTAHHGKVIIEKPYVVFCGPCTIEWMESNFKDELLNGGFGRRCLFIYEEEKRKSVPLPVITPEMRDAIARCQIRLIDIAQMKGGEFKLTNKAKDWYCDWYVNNDKIDGGLLQSYYGNKRMHLLKLAMLHSLSRSDSLILEESDLDAANMFLGRIEEKMETVFRSSGKNEEYPLRVDILNLIESNGQPTRWTQIINNPKLSKKYKRDDMRKAIEVLVEQEKIVDVSELVGGLRILKYKVNKKKEK